MKKCIHTSALPVGAEDEHFSSLGFITITSSGGCHQFSYATETQRNMTQF